MDNNLKEILEKTKKCFPSSFINDNNELIFEPQNNVYFRLEDVQSEIDFKCKLIQWLSRPISKGLNDYYSKDVLENLNQLLNTEFTKEDMRKIYTYLGNGVNKNLCIRFIKSNYDLSLLKDRY